MIRFRSTQLQRLGALAPGGLTELGLDPSLLVTVHAAAAIKHHVVDGDDVLARMLPFLKPRT